jgi:hypothetical protein
MAHRRSKSLRACPGLYPGPDLSPEPFRGSGQRCVSVPASWLRGELGLLFMWSDQGGLGGADR